LVIDTAYLDEMYEKRGYLFEWQVLLAEEAPEFLKAYDQTWTQVNTDRPNGLPAKYRELVYSTVASVLGEATVAKNHMHKALDAGATRTELIDALLVAWTPSGSRTLIHGLRALVEVLKERGEYEAPDVGYRISDRPEHRDRTYTEDKR
jgi:alkylhydroperoxidase/carboxymuconolactone decarboxylase family protein YurZ